MSKVISRSSVVSVFEKTESSRLDSDAGRRTTEGVGRRHEELSAQQLTLGPYCNRRCAHIGKTGKVVAGDSDPQLLLSRQRNVHQTHHRQGRDRTLRTQVACLKAEIDLGALQVVPRGDSGNEFGGRQIHCR